MGFCREQNLLQCPWRALSTCTRSREEGKEEKRTLLHKVPRRQRLGGPFGHWHRKENGSNLVRSLHPEAVQTGGGLMLAWRACKLQSWNLERVT